MPENLDLVRSISAAHERGDYSSAERAHPDIEDYRVLDGERVLVLGHTSSHGNASGVELAAAQRQVATLYQVRDGKVVSGMSSTWTARTPSPTWGWPVSVRVEFSGAARASGVPITGKVFVVYWLRDGVIVRVEDYTERVDVLKAVG